MTAPFTLRRSFFYAAPLAAAMLDAARTLPIDILCLDLEDSTPGEKKVEARQAIADFLAAGRPRAREVLIRVNTLDTEWGHEDLRFATGLGVDGILLPMVEGDGVVRQALQIIAKAAGDKPAPRLWIMIETALGVLRAEQVAAQDIEGIVVGGADLAESLGARHTPSRLPVWHALSQIVLAGRAYNRTVIDAMFSGARDDLEGLEASCIQAAEMGFDGKSVFNADGARLANKSFQPTEQDVAKARTMLSGAGGYGGHQAHARHIIALHEYCAEEDAKG